MHSNGDIRIDRGHHLLGALRLCAADPVSGMHNLALKVGELHDIVVNDPDRPDSGRRQI